MASFLQSVGNEIVGGHQNLPSSVVPLLKLLCLSSIGLVLAHPKINLISKETFKLLSKLVFALFLPCLIFTELGKSVTLKNMREWWFIPANVILSTAIGCILGYLVALICRPPPQYFRFTVVMTGFGNTGNLPLAIVGSICHSSDQPFGQHCNTTGVAYISFAQWVAVILVYTFVYHMLEPPEEFYEIVPEDSEIEREPIGDASRPLLFEAEWPGMHHKETEHCKTPFIARIFRSMSGSTIEGRRAQIQIWIIHIGSPGEHGYVRSHVFVKLSHVLNMARCIVSSLSIPREHILYVNQSPCTVRKGQSSGRYFIHPPT